VANWPLKLRTSSSHEEGAERDFAVMTQKSRASTGHVSRLDMHPLRREVQPIPGYRVRPKADLVLLAMGFVHPVHEG